MELVSTCSTQWSLVHYHHDKRLKCIISTIVSLEKALILHKISHLISMIIPNFDILLGIILFVILFHAQLSLSLEVKGQCSHIDLKGQNWKSVPKAEREILAL